MGSYGQRFVETVGEYLKKNKLFNPKGQITLGKINGATLAELADKFEQAERLKDKREREKRLSKTERDRLFEALAKGTGCDVASMTDTENKRCAVAIAAIIRATPDVRPDEIEAACKRYRREMSGATITTTAISSNWSKLFDSTARKVGVSGSDWAKEPEFDWRRVCSIRYSRDNPKYRERRAWEEDGWALVPPNIKQVIWAEGPGILAKL